MERGVKASIFNGILLVATLFILLTGPLFTNTIVYILTQVFGILLILWALLTRYFSKNTLHKHLPSGYFFVTTGPYELIRHPIYIGYALIILSLVEGYFTLMRFTAVLIIFEMLFLKIIREETTMNREVKEYHNYKQKTKSVIPFLL